MTTEDKSWEKFNEDMDAFEKSLPMWLFDREYRRIMDACEVLHLNESIETLKAFKNNVTKGIQNDTK